MVRPCVQNVPGKLGEPGPAAAHTNWKAAQRLTRTRWLGYISDLACSRLDVEAAELSGFADNHEVFRILLGLLPPRHSSK